MLRRLLRTLVMAPLALVLVFEEWGWAPLAALLGRLARLPLWAALERRITALPPWAAMLTFALPTLALFPVKLAALWLFTAGHPWAGTVLLLAAKLAGTALLAWLFHLTEPALMQLPWFARWYPRWKAWKDHLLTQVRQSWAWRWGRVLKARVQRRARQLRDAWRRWFNLPG